MADECQKGAFSREDSPFSKKTKPFTKKTSPYSKKAKPFTRKTSPFSKKKTKISNLVAHWPFDDNLDTANVIDTKDNYNGTLSDGDNNYTSDHHVEGKVGTGALEFDGDNDYINLGDITELNSVSEFSIGMWVNQDVLGQTDYLFNKKKDSDNLITIYTVTGSIICQVGSVAVAYGAIPNTNIAPAGSWHHLVYTYNGAGTGNAGRLKVYVDGVQKTLGFGRTIPATTADLSGYDATIGKSVGSWDGKIDEVSIFSKELTQAEVDALTPFRFTRKIKTTLLV